MVNTLFTLPWFYETRLLEPHMNLCGHKIPLSMQLEKAPPQSRCSRTSRKRNHSNQNLVLKVIGSLDLYCFSFEVTVVMKFTILLLNYFYYSASTYPVLKVYLSIWSNILKLFLSVLIYFGLIKTHFSFYLLCLKMLIAYKTTYYTWNSSSSLTLNSFFTQTVWTKQYNWWQWWTSKRRDRWVTTRQYSKLISLHNNLTPLPLVKSKISHIVLCVDLYNTV